MSEIDEAEPPRWLAVADFPLIALMMAVLLYAVATTLGHFVSGLIAPLGQPADAALHMLVMLVSVLPVYKLAISRLGERPRDDLPRATALPELAKGAAAADVRPYAAPKEQQSETQSEYLRHFQTPYWTHHPHIPKVFLYRLGIPI